MVDSLFRQQRKNSFLVSQWISDNWKLVASGWKCLTLKSPQITDYTNNVFLKYRPETAHWQNSAN